MTMNYTTLVGARSIEGSIRNWVNRETTPSTTVLTEAEALIYQELRVRPMQQVVTGVLAADADAIDLASEAPRFRQPISFFFTATATVVRHWPAFRPLDEVLQDWEWDSDGNRVDGLPDKWSYEGDNLQFDKPTDVARPWRLTYYGALAPLSVSNETNFLTSRYPTLLRCACLAITASFDKDDKEEAKWVAKLGQQIQRANVDGDLELAGQQIDYDFEA
jgi:hypothetical protein